MIPERREFLKKAAYTAPLIATLGVRPAFAGRTYGEPGGSDNCSRDDDGGYDGGYDGGSGGDDGGGVGDDGGDDDGGFPGKGNGPPNGFPGQGSPVDDE
jgi:hypothetical protein